MDKEKAQAFRECINDYKHFLLSAPGDITAQEKFDILERFEDTWYEPLCFSYNLLAPYDYPKYIKNQWQQAKEVEEGWLFLYITLGYGQWWNRANLYSAMANVEDT